MMHDASASEAAAPHAAVGGGPSSSSSGDEAAGSGGGDGGDGSNGHGRPPLQPSAADAHGVASSLPAFLSNGPDNAGGGGGGRGGRRDRSSSVPDPPPDHASSSEYATPSPSGDADACAWKVGTTDAVLRASSARGGYRIPPLSPPSPPRDPLVAAGGLSTVPDAVPEVEVDVDAAAAAAPPDLPPALVALPDTPVELGLEEGGEGGGGGRRRNSLPHSRGGLLQRSRGYSSARALDRLDGGTAEAATALDQLRAALPGSSGSGVGAGAPTSLSVLSQGRCDAEGGGPMAADDAVSADSASAPAGDGAAAAGAVAAAAAAVPASEGGEGGGVSGGGGTAALADPAAAYVSLYQDRLFDRPSPSVDAVLSAACEGVGFDIAEMWLRTGPKTHQLTNSHLRPTALEDSVRSALVDVYYGEKSSERTHRLSPALCKRAKEAQDVVWVTASTDRGAEALRCSISDVRTAVAVPVCHEISRTNITLIFFSVRRAIMRPQAVEFLVHMSLASAVASVSSIAEDIAVDQPSVHRPADGLLPPYLSRSGHVAGRSGRRPGSGTASASSASASAPVGLGGRGGMAAVASAPVVPRRHPHQQLRDNVSVTGAQLDLRWSALKNVEYLTDGGNSWIHTAVMNGRPVVVKTLKPECQDLAIAINEIEGELEIHSKLDHPNIVGLVGAGTTSKGSRFVVLERLDGGTLTQMLGYDTRIRDRRRRFWKRRQFSYGDVLRCARSIASAMDYCHRLAVPGSAVLHRDLKPSNIGFTLDRRVKLIDFGLARVVEGASPESDEVYEMSGETGSLRYMAPEVADCRPYNLKADVYSFGIIFWEIVSFQKPFDGMSRDEFYMRVIHGGERPVINKKWPAEVSDLMQQCWDFESEVRPTFAEIVERLDALITKDIGGSRDKKKTARKRIISLLDRHSTWF